MSTAQSIVRGATVKVGETLSRAQSATGADVRPFVAQRMAEATATISRVGIAAAAAELCNAALMRLAELCYERDYDGSQPNIAHTGRIEIAVPMAKQGHRYFGLRRLEQEVLRACLVARESRQDTAPVFVYNPDDRRWYLNLSAYPTEQAAQEHLRRMPIGAREYRRHHDRLKAIRTPAAR